MQIKCYVIRKVRTTTSSTKSFYQLYLTKVKDKEQEKYIWAARTGDRLLKCNDPEGFELKGRNLLINRFNGYLYHYCNFKPEDLERVGE